MPTTSGVTIGGASRRPSRSSLVIANPAAVIVSIVGRLQLQPWLSFVCSPLSLSCHRARRSSSTRTCSMNSRAERRQSRSVATRDDQGEPAVLSWIQRLSTEQGAYGAESEP
jgi:hypothetical protein